VSLTPLGVEHHHEVSAMIYAHIKALGGMTEAQLCAYWQDLGVCDWLDFHYKQVGGSALLGVACKGLRPCPC
jgi:hypothetical protein